MPEFSDVLRQRLASREVAKDHHPDADTLSAFSESLLSLAERDQILNHLALCRECREVVSLSLTETDAAAAESQLAVVAQRKAARPGWTRWFGLAGSLAAMAVVATIIVKLPQLHRSAPTPQEQAKVEPLSKVEPQPTSAPAANQTTAVPAPLPAKALSRSGAATRTRELSNRAASVVGARVEAATPPPPVLETPRATASTVSAIAEAAPRRDYVNDKIFAQNDAGRNAVTDGELPTAAGLSQNKKETNAAQLSIFPDPVQQPANPSMAKTLTPASSGHSGFPSITPKVLQATKNLLHKRLPAIGGSAFGFAMGPGEGQFNPTNGRTQAVEAESTTSAAKPGADLDQTQAFTRRATTPSAMTTVNTGFQPSWTVEDSKLLRTTESGAWIAGYVGTPSIDFSVVTSHGADVWAGGNRAALIHSRDGGVNWERVRLGANASGRITSISVTGQNVEIATEGQTWSSDDGGKTWTQQ